MEKNKNTIEKAKIILNEYITISSMFVFLFVMGVNPFLFYLKYKSYKNFLYNFEKYNIFFLSLLKILHFEMFLIFKYFIYNNDKAPCFDFKLQYDDNDFNRVVLLRNYKLSNIFKATFDGKSISFPIMATILIIF